MAGDILCCFCILLMIFHWCHYMQFPLKSLVVVGKFYNWQNMILLTFGYDPLKCPKCGKSMFAFEVYYKKTALFEQYRKVMGYG